jgi:hypothetical protein
MQATYIAVHGRQISKDIQNPKWVNTRIGVCVPTKGEGLCVILNYLPPPNKDGSYTFMLYVPKDREEE